MSDFLPITIFVGPSSERADSSLAKVLKNGISRRKLKEAFYFHQVLWNGTPLSAKFSLPPGTHTLWLDPTLLQEPKSLLVPSSQLTLTPIYEDERFLVLNKPSGIASVTQDPSHPETAMGWALAKFPELAKIIRKPGKKEAGLLNRLDTGTSGILIFAKDQKTFDLAWNLWKSSQIQKIYRCLVTSPASLQTISYPLTKHPRSSKKMLAIIRKSQHVRDRLFPATTHLLKKHGPPSDHQQQIIDLEVQIVTGVRHQIRAHLAAIHCPILGDLLYRGKPSNRLWLHAWTLTLKFPDQKFHWEAPLPQTWTEDF